MDEPQPIEVPADVPRGQWYSRQFENDVTGDRYVAVVPTFGPQHFHRDCWCGPTADDPDDPHSMIVHQAPPN